jgi:hypothetical protein
MELRAKPLRAESKPIANCGIRIADLGNSKGVRAKGKSKKAIADFEFRIVVRIPAQCSSLHAPCYFPLISGTTSKEQGAGS